jgi:hypothetical protein
MRERSPSLDARLAPRIDVEAFCSEILPGGQRPALVVDLSADGLRIERPYLGGRTPDEMAVELELPGVDEVIWARVAVCFNRIRPGGGPFGLVRTTGLRIIAAAERDLRLLRELVAARAARYQPQPNASP